MFTSEYEEKNITSFRGLYSRGKADNTPTDHATELQNMMFSNKGECSTRDGYVISLTLNHPVKRLFTSAIGSVLTPLTMDVSGNIYKGTDGTPILTVTNMIDFVAINLFNKTYIAPVLSTGTTTLRVWDGTNAVRNAAGAAPTAGSTISASTSATAGNISAGTHKIAVVYVTNTGFKTPPGVKVAGIFTPNVYGAPGSFAVDISNIPVGPTGTSQRQIIATKAGLEEYFIVPGGLINNNTSTTLTVDFADTDLIVSADYLFDLLETVPVGGYGTGLDKFDGRMIVFGAEGNLIRVSLSGDVESFNNVSGYIQLPDENDGNNVAGSFNIRDSLYFTKFPGIFVMNIVDRAEPSTWVPILVDGGVGAIRYGISTISATQTHLTASDLVLLADLQGLTVFDGVARKPVLTWKIDTYWRAYVTVLTASSITVQIDPFSENIYLYVDSIPFVFVGNFSEGITAESIKWSSWNWAAISLSVISISMSTYQDSEFTYALRLGFSAVNFVMRLKPGQVTDAGAGISAFYQTALLSYSSGMDIFSALRLRISTRGSGDANITVNAIKEDLQSSTLLWTLPIALGQAPQYEPLRQINYTAEKMAIRVSSLSTSGMTLQRIDVFGKQLWQTRPG